MTQGAVHDLSGEAYVDLLSCEMREMVMDVCAHRDIELYARFRSEREDWVQSMVMAQMGFAFMPEYSVTLSGLMQRPLVDPEVTLRGRWPCLSFRPRIAIRQHPLHRAVGRGWHRALRRSVGDSHDNALAETINGLFKAEVIHRRGPWRSFEAVEFATLEWVDWFNHRRLLEPIGNLPPAEAEAAYYAKLEAVPIAA